MILRDYNNWVIGARKELLTDLAPRVYALDGAIYPGCSLATVLEITLGMLIQDFAIPCTKFTSKELANVRLFNELKSSVNQIENSSFCGKITS